MKSSRYGQMNARIVGMKLGGQQIDKPQTFYKARMVQFALNKKLMSVALAMKQPEFETHMGNCFRDLEESLEVLNQNRGAYQVAKRAKVMLKMARFADKILRRLEDNPGAEGEQIRAALDSLGKDKAAMAKVAVEASLDALNMGSVAATDFIPRLLDIVG